MPVTITPPVASPKPPPAPERQEPVVRAVIFWLNGCPHCHEVIDHVLPLLQQKYGDKLDIRLIELVTTEDVDRLYETAAVLGIPKEHVTVPFLILGDRVLIGSAQIPAELPGLIEQHLAAGGVDYPNLPGLVGVLPVPTPNPAGCAPGTPCADETGQQQATSTPVSVAQANESRPPIAPSAARPGANGFGLAVTVMIGMVGALVYTGVVLARGFQGALPRPTPAWLNLATPLLALAGLGVAGYLAYVETQHVSAVCGPVGDCNAVQGSPYARLFGVLPVGVLGAVGYTAILAVWLWRRVRSDVLAEYAPLATFGAALFGVLFSLYLTYLELFVIRAVCAWCLTSSVIITLLLLLSIGPALQAATMVKEEAGLISE